MSDPLTFSYPWHKETLSHFSEQIKQGSVHHAMLIKARTGFHDEMLAKRFAKRILCDQQLECNTCQHCRFVDAGSHPNLIELGNNEEKVGINDIRKIETSAWQTATFEKPKLFIVHSIDQLSINAQNAILKTLEEPPANTFFILTAYRQSAILPTIISRIQRVMYKEKQSNLTSLIMLWLKEQLPQVDNQQMETLLSLPLSGPLDILKVGQDSKQIQILKKEKQYFAQFMMANIDSNAFISIIDTKNAAPQLYRLQTYVEKTIKSIYQKIPNNISKQVNRVSNQNDDWKSQATWKNLNLDSCYQLYDSLLYLQRLSFTNVNMELQISTTLSHWQKTYSTKK